ncbi:uncharacterized protein [Argopecten irradians]|uniref:uncharacterized protein n=1 Tax=Argopecten irradians TaxID=31199 RepID=UPI0037172DFA
MADDTKRKRSCQKFTDPGESKRRRKLLEASRAQNRIRIGDQSGRWRNLREKLKLRTDAELAAVLLDRYEHSEENILPKHPTFIRSTSTLGPSTPVLSEISAAESAGYKISEENCPSSTILSTINKLGQSTLTSTPLIHSAGPILSSSAYHTPVLSEISVAESAGETTLSGLEEVPELSIEQLLTSEDSKAVDDPRKRRRKQVLSGSFVNPLELTLDISEEETEEESYLIKDPDYSPEFKFSIMPEGMNDNIEELAFEESQFGEELLKKEITALR